MNGLRMVSGSEDRSIRLWDIETGQRLSTNDSFHTWGLSVISFSPDGDFRATGDEAGTILLVDPNNAMVLVETVLAHTHEVTGIAWRPGGSGMASSSADGTVKLWEWPELGSVGWEVQKEPQMVFPHPDAVTAVLWTLVGAIIITSCSDATIRLWDVHSASVVCCLEGHSRAVTCLSWTPNQSKLFSGSKDGTIRAWDISTFTMDKYSRR